FQSGQHRVRQLAPALTNERLDLLTERHIFLQQRLVTHQELEGVVCGPLLYELGGQLDVARRIDPVYCRQDLQRPAQLDRIVERVNGQTVAEVLKLRLPIG